MAESAGRTTPTRTETDRGAIPAIGKVLEVGIVILYVGLVTTALFGGIVPEYRTSAANEVGDRTLASASQQIQQTVPPNANHVEAHAYVDLPDLIRGDAYEITAEDRNLALDHPHPEVDARTALALPEAVVEVSGTWSSTDPALVVVESTDDGLVVRLERGDPR